MNCTYLQLTAPCPRCGADCSITDSSVTCSSCNLAAVRLLHRSSSPSCLIIAEDLAELRIEKGRAGVVVKYRGGTLMFTGSVGQINLDKHRNVRIKGGGGASVERFNDVLVEHAAGDVSVERCRDVRLDASGNVYVKRCHDVHLDAAGDAYVKRCHDIHLDAAGDACVKRCHDVRLEAAGNIYVKRCNNVRVEGRAGEVDVKHCKDVDVESGGSVCVKRSKDVRVDGGMAVSIQRCNSVEVTEGNGVVEIKRCSGVSLVNASGRKNTAKNCLDLAEEN